MSETRAKSEVQPHFTFSLAEEFETRKVENAGPTRVSTDPLLYFDRDFGLIEFQTRVFEEAQDRTNPLLERVSSRKTFSTSQAQAQIIKRKNQTRRQEYQQHQARVE